MPDEKADSTAPGGTSVALSAMPRDELIGYAQGLGLETNEHERPQEIVLRIRRRQELLIELEREALLDILAWAHRPVPKEAGKEDLAGEIARLETTHYENLTHRGLVALARLRDIDPSPLETDDQIVARLRKRDGFWKNLARVRRSVVASVVAKMVEGHQPPAEQPTTPEQPMPAAKPSSETLRKQIEERGLVGGLATRIKGAADDYVAQKLDEIEERIDAKLDQIDHRLAEWRDREVANRLKILRLTLIFTALVALLSLGYNVLKARVVPKAEPAAVLPAPAKP